MDSQRRSRQPLKLLTGIFTLLVLGGCASAAGTPSPSPATSASTAASTSVDALDVGAVGDGTTDDAAALQAALDGMTPGQTLVLAEGRTFAVGDVLTVRVPGTRITGGGTLLATDEEKSSLTVDGTAGANDVHVEGITLAITGTTKRWEGDDQQRLRIAGGTGLVVSDVTITGSAAAGVFVGGGATGFSLDGVRVSDTRADGIHITQGSSDGSVSDPVISRSGDDGVAVVSYAEHGEPCHDIIVERPVVRGTVIGRGVSVVGGHDVTFRHVDVDASGAAGVYVASEGSYDTTDVQRVLIDGGRVTRANTDADTDHGAVLIYDGSGRPVTDVEVRDLSITSTRATASRQVGVLAQGGGGITGVRLEDLVVSGGPSQALEVTGGAQVSATGWLVDGKAVDLP